ncbi:MAG TPA: AIR synthase-related protein, partial [Acidimicrobiales bacterium]
TLSGSTWAWSQGHRRGTPPALDLDRHRATCDVIRGLVNDHLVVGVHDAGGGGIGVALAEMAVDSRIGIEVQPPDDADHRWVFAESPSCFVLCVDPASSAEVERRSQEAGVSVATIGTVGGDRISIGKLVDLSLADTVDRWQGRLPEALGQGTTQG